MLDFLFRRLTATAPRGAALFDAVTGIAREPHWYVEGQVPDTIDGRFAVLSTIIALILVRLEADGDKGELVSVGLTERFIEVMEAEHRQLGTVVADVVSGSGREAAAVEGDENRSLGVVRRGCPDVERQAVLAVSTGVDVPVDGPAVRTARVRGQLR